MSVQKDKTLMLAPLAGVSDAPFRLICQSYGADKTFTEMISANGLKYDSKKTEDLTYIDEREKNVGLQLFGSDEKILEEVIRERINPREDIKEINFNMGCPAPKVTKNGAGSALLKDTQKVERILKALVKASNKPVSLKYRLGFDDLSINYLEVGKIAQDAGISYLILHGRTREQFYSGKADREAIRALKEAVDIPVIANGDIFSVEDYLEAMEVTGADGVMLARGAMGRPYLFKQIKDYEETGTYEKPSDDRILDDIEAHYRLFLEFQREDLVIKQMRKQVGRYTKGLANSSRLREEINRLNDLEEIFALLENYRKYLKEIEGK